MRSKIAGCVHAITVAAATASLLWCMPAASQTYFNIGALYAGQTPAAIQQLQLQITNELNQLNAYQQQQQTSQLQARANAFNAAGWVVNSVMLVVGGVSVATGATGALIIAGEVGRTLMRDSLSCPVFEGGGTLLGEDSCAWTKVTGQRTAQYGVNTDSVGLRLGGQREIAPDWFLGGTLHADTSWTQVGAISSTGQTYDGSVALKHVMGPWLLGAVVAFGTGANHTTRPAFNGGTMQGDLPLFFGSARLRGAYEFTFSGWYARPRLDLDLGYVNQPGHQEYGPDQTGLSIGGYQKMSTAISPALELGGRVDMGAAILRPYVVTGATFLPDNKRTIAIGFTGLPELGTLNMVADGPSVLGTLEAGLQLYRAHGLEVKGEYGLQAGTSYLNQSLSLRGAYHF